MAHLLDTQESSGTILSYYVKTGVRIMNALPFVFPLLRETKVPDTYQNSPLQVSFLLLRDEVEAGLPGTILLLTLFSFQRKPSISAWSRHFSNDPRTARELLIGYGGFHYCATHLKLGQLGRD